MALEYDGMAIASWWLNRRSNMTEQVPVESAFRNLPAKHASNRPLNRLQSDFDTPKTHQPKIGG